jgi:hypothetical protein
MDLLTLLIIDALVVIGIMAFYIGYLIATYQQFMDEPEVKASIRQAISRVAPTTP